MAEEDHPLFWDNINPNNDFFEGLKVLNEDSTPEERAETHKQNGNEFFKLGKERYSDAIYSYTAAICEDISDPLKKSIFYSNRAMVNYQLGNYGKVIEDCKEAINLDKDNIKAYFKAAQASYALKKFEQTIQFCNGGIQTTTGANNKPLLTLLNNATTKKAHEDEIKRKKEEEENRILAAKLKLENALSERKILLGTKLYKTTAQFEGQVHWDEDGSTLRWPVVFTYPEYSQCDFIESFSENDRVIDHLEQMFPGDQPVFWDTEQKYVFDELCVYYQTNATGIGGKPNYKKKRWIQVNVHSTLLEVLQLPDHIVPQFPILAIFVKGSSFLKRFLEGENE